MIGFAVLYINLPPIRLPTRTDRSEIERRVLNPSQMFQQSLVAFRARGGIALIPELLPGFEPFSGRGVLEIGQLILGGDEREDVQCLLEVLAVLIRMDNIEGIEIKNYGEYKEVLISWRPKE